MRDIVVVSIPALALRFLSDVENLPGFCVVGVQGIFMNPDEPNLTFNPGHP